MKDFPRFRAPTAADDLARCRGCHTMFYYTELNDEGYCADCRTEDDEEED